MNPRDFYALADELAKANSPAKRRSAISRAYYSAFHVGVDALRSLGFTVSKGAAGHGEVVRCLVNSGDSPTSTAALRLSDLHSVRNRADYQLERVDVEQSSNTRAAVDQARVIIETFDRVAIAPNRSQIQAAIASWRKSNGYP